jgi:hypothetical protein
VRLFPGSPPIVPLIPEIDFIKVISSFFQPTKVQKKDQNINR